VHRNLRIKKKSVISTKMHSITICKLKKKSVISTKMHGITSYKFKKVQMFLFHAPLLEFLVPRTRQDLVFDHVDILQGLLDRHLLLGNVLAHLNVMRWQWRVQEVPEDERMM
jgi:hypothetical protein